MIHPTLHNTGAPAARQGTAARGRIESLGSAWLRCHDVSMFGVNAYAQGDRTP